MYSNELAAGLPYNSMYSSAVVPMYSSTAARQDLNSVAVPDMLMTWFKR